MMLPDKTGDEFSGELPEITSVKDLERAIRIARPLHERHLGDLLVEKGLLTNVDLNRALEQQSKNPFIQLGTLLQDMGLVSQNEIHQALARKLGIPRVSLKSMIPSPAVMAEINADIAMRYNVMPLAVLKDRLIIAMENPLDWNTLELLQFHTNHRIETVIASREELNRAIGTYYGRIDEKKILDEIHSDEMIGESPAVYDPSRNAIEQEAGKKPVVRLIRTVILQGILRGASDIHIRPGKDAVDILYRVDGVLQYSRRVEKSLLMPLIARIKILGNMDIAEHRLPQDGHARLSHQDNVIDMRISVMPSIKGESAVIRILDKSMGLRSLGELGFLEHELKQLGLLMTHNHGMFLVTGPTGSGKSTTLYAMLNVIRQRNPHIITVEDPVEYDMDDVEQMQVRNVIGYTFAEALRHILRHDPDVIMVGEIRDLETGRISVKSALTGHLVLSTLHTNDAASAITRLTEMGIEPYLVSATLLGVLAQRLVRRICLDCREVDERASDEIRKLFGISEDENVYHGKGCPTCSQTGYHGRTTVVELLTLTPSLVEMINRGVPEEQLRAEAIREGMRSLTDNGLELVRRGITTLEEVFSIRLE
jgi:type IV pilus assembly protein PilB